MSYNKLLKFAYRKAVPDNVYGVRYVDEPGDAPGGYTDPLDSWLSGLPSYDAGAMNNMAASIARGSLGAAVDSTFGTAIHSSTPDLASNQNKLYQALRDPASPDYLPALGIYNKLVHGAMWNRNDPEYLALKEDAYFKEMADKLESGMDAFKQQNPNQYNMAQMAGETLAGSMVRQQAENALFNGMYEEGVFGQKDSSDAKAALKRHQDLAKQRAYQSSFSRYAPGMAIAGLAPVALGSLIGRPWIGALIGALLSGGVGYYGYNRLNGTGKPIEWLDNMLGYQPQMSEEAKTAWEQYNSNLGNKRNTEALTTSPESNTDTIPVTSEGIEEPTEIPRGRVISADEDYDPFEGLEPIEVSEFSEDEYPQENWQHSSPVITESKAINTAPVVNQSNEMSSLVPKPSFNNMSDTLSAVSHVVTPRAREVANTFNNEIVNPAKAMVGSVFGVLK